MSNELLNLLSDFFGPDKLEFWRAIACMSTVLLALLAAVIYDSEASDCLSCLVVASFLLFTVVVYCGWIFTYFYNKPLGPALDLIVPI